MQARYYDPVIGRFYSNDPVDAATFISQGNIHGFNRYTYVNNNPYKYVDPYGTNGMTPYAMMKNDQRVRELDKGKTKGQIATRYIKMSLGTLSIASGGILAPVAGAIMFADGATETSVVAAGLQAAGVEPVVADAVGAGTDIVLGGMGLKDGLKDALIGLVKSDTAGEMLVPLVPLTLDAGLTGYEMSDNQDKIEEVFREEDEN